MTTLYILHSKKLEKYYCGITEMTIEERLKRHLYDLVGYTAQVKDWGIASIQKFLKLKRMLLKKRNKSKSVESKFLLECIITEIKQP